MASPTLEKLQIAGLTGQIVLSPDRAAWALEMLLQIEKLMIRFVGAMLDEQSEKTKAAISETLALIDAAIADELLNKEKSNGTEVRETAE